MENDDSEENEDGEKHLKTRMREYYDNDRKGNEDVENEESERWRE